MNAPQTLLDEVMDEFDFEQVAIAMQALDWTWATSDSEDHIPTKAEMRRCVRDLIHSAFRALRDDLLEVRTGTGGFWATVRRDVEGFAVEVSFKVESWDGATGP